MLSEEIKRFIAGVPVAFVASTDGEGHPHLAAGKEIKVLDDDHLAIENWFCRTTLRNVASNPRVAVAVVTPETGNGYQLSGTVTQAFDTAILNGYGPGVEAPGTPQTLTRFVIRVEEIMEFSAGMHTDLPLDQ